MVMGERGVGGDAEGMRRGKGVLGEFGSRWGGQEMVQTFFRLLSLISGWVAGWWL